MSTDLNLLSKGLIRLGILIFLFIITPIIITFGFKALDKFTEAPKLYVAYAIIFIGVALLFFTMYFAFKTFGIIKNAIFDNN
ncbi:hypothetical protein SAMN05216503_2092 [Polaribacter sp. KT25b]|uniref:DUF6095 family protein n=1 Tax=Polaribacter sp. KT25b TaxID=1855336 RepID=UPI00087AD44F|nr:DUF6095 family protein [Polaribacter sp. KT25b]SDS13905.1 hypothetical protein SAMN05216503_2092 [Polaribacter sp. KT25b]